MIARLLASTEQADSPPPQIPVSIIDMERGKGTFDMSLPMQDPCPACGAFRMRVGDYACWGTCFICAEKP